MSEHVSSYIHIIVKFVIYSRLNYQSYSAFGTDSNGETKQK